jgi:hypothetical protein
MQNSVTTVTFVTEILAQSTVAGPSCREKPARFPAAGFGVDGLPFALEFPQPIHHRRFRALWATPLARFSRWHPSLQPTTGHHGFLRIQRWKWGCCVQEVTTICLNLLTTIASALSNSRRFYMVGFIPSRYVAMQD